MMGYEPRNLVLPERASAQTLPPVPSAGDSPEVSQLTFARWRSEESCRRLIEAASFPESANEQNRMARNIVVPGTVRMKTIPPEQVTMAMLSHLCMGVAACLNELEILRGQEPILIGKRVEGKAGANGEPSTK